MLGSGVLKLRAFGLDAVHLLFPGERLASNWMFDNPVYLIWPIIWDQRLKGELENTCFTSPDPVTSNDPECIFWDGGMQRSDYFPLRCPLTSDCRTWWWVTRPASCAPCWRSTTPWRTASSGTGTTWSTCGTTPSAQRSSALILATARSCWPSRQWTQPRTVKKSLRYVEIYHTFCIITNDWRHHHRGLYPESKWWSADAFCVTVRIATRFHFQPRNYPLDCSERALDDLAEAFLFSVCVGWRESGNLTNFCLSLWALWYVLLSFTGGPYSCTEMHRLYPVLLLGIVPHVWRRLVFSSGDVWDLPVCRSLHCYSSRADAICPRWENTLWQLTHTHACLRYRFWKTQKHCCWLPVATLNLFQTACS